MGKNVLLFFMSVYRLSDGDYKSRPQTNQTVIKDLCKSAAKRPDFMIALCSDDVRTDKTVTYDGEKITTLDYFRCKFMPTCGFAQEQLICVEVPNSLQEADQTRAIYKVLQHINSDDHLYIDMTGGMRDTAMLLITTARYLRDIRQIDTPQVLYAETVTPYNVKPSQYAPRDCNQLYKLFDLISATDEFFSTGSARKLQKYFAETSDPDVQELLKRINTFSSDLALSRTGKIKKDLQNLRKVLNAIKVPQDEPSSINDLFFNLLKERFDDEFSGSKDKDSSSRVRKEELFPYQIEWCVKHNLYQQALTLLAENMPQFVCDHIFLQPTQKEWDYLENQEQGKEPNKKRINAGKAWPGVLFHALFGSRYLSENGNRTKNENVKPDIWKKPHSYLPWRESESEDVRQYLTDLRDSGQWLEFDELTPELEQVVNSYAFIIASRNHINHAGNDFYPKAISGALALMDETDIHDRLSKITDLLNCIQTMRPAEHANRRDTKETFK